MKLKLIIGILISIVFLYLSFLKVDVQSFWNALVSAQYWYFFPAMAVVIFLFILRAYRWKYLLILQKNMSLLNVFSATSIGAFANNVLPMRAGEFIRAYVVARNEKTSASAILATILVERIADVFSLLIIAVAAILLLPIPQSEHYETIKSFGSMLLLVEVAVLVFCFMLLWKRDFTLRLTHRVLSVFPKKIAKAGSGIVDSFLDGLEILRAVQHLFTVIWSSFAIWLLNFIVIILIMLAFNIRLDIPTMLVAATAVLIFSAFSITIPSSPGFIGTYHFFTQQALVLFSIDPNIGLGFAVVLHASSFIPITLTGFYFFLKENVKFAAVTSGEKNPSESPAGQT